ncbi:UNVERIFIED_ORG: hypothetical protein J3D59_001918 [Pseudomonas fluorescens]
MHRDQYLGKSAPVTSPVVQDFVDWLATRLYDTSLFAHQYTDRRSQCIRSFSGLYDACKNYHWPHQGALGNPAGVCLTSSDVTLKALGNALKSALAQKSDPCTLIAASGIIKWGGVSAGNVRWLTNNSSGLPQLLAKTAAAFSGNSLADPVLLNTLLRFNAGMTKVYSLLVNDFIIYDSRVAAALGWIVVKYCQDRQLATVPAELAFPWAPAKEGPAATWRKNRNPAKGTLRFPGLNGAVQHAHWNLKASWILAEVLANASAGAFTDAGPIAPLRRLEAALFMIGYDLPHNGPSSSQTGMPAKALPTDMNECFTIAKQKRFFYAVDQNGIRMGNGRRHSIAQINSLLTALWKAFGNVPFPLANSATKVRKDEAPYGIGAVYFEITERKGNPPDTSSLAAALHEIGALSYTRQGPDNWSINISQLARTPDVTALDISALIQHEIGQNDLL